MVDSGHSDANDEARERKYSAENNFAAVVATGNMAELDLTAFCREHVFFKQNSLIIKKCTETLFNE